MKRTISLGLMFFLLACGSGEDPVPVLPEEGVPVVSLVLERTIGGELEEGMELMEATSLDVDYKGNIYVYDSIQQQIIKMDPEGKPLHVFGRRGAGPGEFRHPRQYMNIFIGRDGCLYADDSASHLILVFSRTGEFLRQIDYADYRQHAMFQKRMVDRTGNLYFHRTEEEELVFFTPQGSEIFRVPLEPKWLTFINPDYNGNRYHSPEAEISLFFARREGPKFLYFGSSSILVILDGNNKIRKEVPVFPREARERYRSRIRKLAGEKKQEQKQFGSLFTYTPFFGNLIFDSTEQILYIEFFSGPGQADDRYYGFDAQGELVRILRLPQEESRGLWVLMTKWRNRLYGRGEENILIYREEGESR